MELTANGVAAAPLTAAAATVEAGDRVRGELVAITGGTGRTGVILIEQLLKLGCQVRVLTRSKERGAEKLDKLEGYERVELVQGDADSAEALNQMLAPGANGGAVARIYYCAGGEQADPERVNNVGVGMYAKEGKSRGVKQIVVISAAWVSKPWSFCSVLFNNIVAKCPCGQHQVGEEIVRSTGIDYAMVRAARILEEDKPVKRGVKIDQGDRLGFLEGGKGMTTTQLAEVCLQAARHVTGRVTFEVMGDPLSQSGKAKELGPAQFDPLQADEKYVPLSWDPLAAHQRAACVVKYCFILFLLLILAGIITPIVLWLR